MISKGPGNWFLNGNLKSIFFFAVGGILVLIDFQKNIGLVEMETQDLYIKISTTFVS